MSPTLIVIIVSILILGLFVLGLSITIIRKGRFIESEISQNQEMKRRGIKCVLEETKELDKKLYGKKSTKDKDIEICSGNCASCLSEDDK